MNTISRQLLPWIKVVLAQAVVLAALWAVHDWLPSAGAPLVFAAMLLAQGAAAALVGRMIGLSAFWIPIQLLLPLALAFSAEVPAWAYLAAFLVCALIYWNSASEQVPLYLTNRRTFEALGALVETTKAKSVVDLGSGMGGVVLYLAKRYPRTRVRGVETAPLVYLAARLRLVLARQKNAELLYRSIWDEDLGAHDIVYCFLSPVPMARIFEKARAEMRPGTLLVSNSFAVPGQEPSSVIDVDDGRRTRLHLYRM